MAKFPALQWLGYGLDMTALRPFDLKAVLDTVKRTVMIIDIKKDEKRTVNINGVDYEIPKCVSVSQNTTSQTGGEIYNNGTAAVRAIQQDLALAFRFLVVTGTSSDTLTYPLDRWFPATNQFLLYYFHSDNHLASLRDYIDFLNESALQRAVSLLPTPFMEDPEVILAYRTFFDTYGSHVITNTSYGARFLMNVWASNNHADVNNNFRRDVTAMVRGINSSWVYDESVFEEPQYQTFNRLSQSVFSAYGGDPSRASALSMNQIDRDTFTEWQDSTTTHPDLVHIQTIPLWSLFLDADSATLRDSADSIRGAFQYLASSPEEQLTTFITFQIKASWAELGLLIPSVVVVGGDTPDVIPPPSVTLSPTKLRWGAQGAEPAQFFAILMITNDTTPIDFYITCDDGKATATIAGVEYVNDGEEGKTKWFSQVPVTRSADTEDAAM